MRLALLALPLALGCSDDALTRVHGSLELTDVIDFGDVRVGTEETIDLEIRNVGSARVDVHSIDPAPNFTGDGYEFSVDRSAFTVQPSEVHSLRVGFLPLQAPSEPHESMFAIITEEEPIMVTVRGHAIASCLLVEPNPSDFGAVLVGATKHVDVKVTNVCSEPSTLTAPVAGGKIEIEEDVTPNRFTVDTAVGADGIIGVLGAGGSITLDVAYTPVAADRPDRGRFFVSDCASDLCRVAVVLLGTGSNTALACTPPSLDFGAVAPGATRTLSTSCQNVAGTPIEVANAALTSGSATEYALAPLSLPAALQPDEVIELSVDYSPTEATYQSGAAPQGTIDIRTQDPSGRPLDPVQIALTGSAGGPSIQVLPATLDFGMIALGTSHRKQLLVINEGRDDLNVLSVDADTAATGAFTVDRTSFVLPAGESMIIGVTFTPQMLGAATSSLVISSNDTTRPMVEVPLAGTGVDLPPCSYRIVPSMLSFGVVTAGNMPVQSFRVDNVGSNDCLLADLDFVAPVITASNAFSLVNGPETSIVVAPGMSHDVPVRYRPTTSSTDRAVVGFYVNDPLGSDAEVPVFGVGEATIQVQCPAQITTSVGTPVTLTAMGTVTGANLTGYRWTIGSAPTGGIGTPNQWTPDPPDQATESFLPFIVGTYDILVEVLDDQGRSASCTTRVIAQGEGLVTTLTWDGSGDVDLHVHNQNITPWFDITDDDCYYGNTTPIWDPAFNAGQGPNPELDFDNTSADGPENTRVATVVLNQPYTIAVHNYAGAAGRIATIDIYCGGVMAPTYTAMSRPLQGNTGGDCESDDFWRVATVVFSSQSQCTVTPINTYTAASQSCVTF